MLARLLNLCVMCHVLPSGLLAVDALTVGDYDVTIPEDTMSGMYKIRVGPFEEEDLFDCSGEFEIIGEDGDDGSMSFRF